MINFIGFCMWWVIREIKRDEMWRFSWKSQISYAIQDTIKNVSKEDADAAAELFLKRLTSK